MGENIEKYVIFEKPFKNGSRKVYLGSYETVNQSYHAVIMDTDTRSNARDRGKVFYRCASNLGTNPQEIDFRKKKWREIKEMFNESPGKQLAGKIDPNAKDEKIYSGLRHLLEGIFMGSIGGANEVEFKITGKDS